MARLQFSPAVHSRVRRWLVDGDFDVLHLHEPNAPSLSMWALRVAEGPIVATFHTSTTKSLTLSVFQGVLRPWHDVGNVGHCQSRSGAGARFGQFRCGKPGVEDRSVGGQRR
ncbi:glycosyltransferase family 4 protein [Actinomadura welshii]